jgi:ribosomal protein S18 acetylase RimI-like enzyme
VSELERIVAFTRALDDARADELVPFAWGTALFNRALWRLWDWNQVRLERDGDGLDARVLAREADRLQGGARLAHRKISVDDGGLGERLAPQFDRLGWRTQRLLVMVSTGEPDRADDLWPVEEAAEPALRPARVAANGGVSNDTVRQVLRAKRVRAEVASVRWFAARADGEVASYCEVYSDGRIAQIEDVATVPAHRRRGLARAVVLRTLAEARAAGHDLVFLTADEDDWPKALYERLGFETVGRFYGFVRAA